MLGGRSVRRATLGAPMSLPFSPQTPPDTSTQASSRPPSQSFDLIALSLTPFAWRRTLGERLRAGEPARIILDEWVRNRRLNRDGVDRPTLMSRVAAAVTRAADR